MVAALLTGMWVLPATPLVFPSLLAVLVLCLFDVVAPTPTAGGGGGRCLVMVARRALGGERQRLAAKDSGGACYPPGLRAGQARPGLPAAVLWLGAAFALLPSPVQAQRWALAFCAVPTLFLKRGGDITCTRLWSRLAWLPAHPVGLIALGLLPSRPGPLCPCTGCSIPGPWRVSRWRMACWCNGGRRPSLRRRCPRVARCCPWRTRTRQRNATYWVSSASVLAIGLQPFHGLAPGMVAVFALVLLFALQVLPPGRFHHDVDWALAVRRLVARFDHGFGVPPLPSCVAGLAPDRAGPSVLLLLRTVLPSVGAASVALLPGGPVAGAPHRA